MAELQSKEVKVSQVTQQFLDAPLREAVGYTANGRKKIKELSTEARKVFASSVTRN